jgi:hypothetical protein
MHANTLFLTHTHTHSLSLSLSLSAATPRNMQLSQTSHLIGYQAKSILHNYISHFPLSSQKPDIPLILGYLLETAIPGTLSVPLPLPSSANSHPSQSSSTSFSNLSIAVLILCSRCTTPLSSMLAQL